MEDPYLSDHTSDEESDDEASVQSESSASALPYPYVGRPYVTNSLLNTIDLKFLHQCVKEMSRVKVKCIQLQCPKYRLSHILFGSQAVSFSSASSKWYILH